MSDEQQDAARRVFWQLAIARALHARAFADRRWDDVNYYAKQIEVAELEARALLKH